MIKLFWDEEQQKIQDDKTYIEGPIAVEENSQFRGKQISEDQNFVDKF